MKRAAWPIRVEHAQRVVCPDRLERLERAECTGWWRRATRSTRYARSGRVVRAHRLAQTERVSRAVRRGQSTQSGRIERPGQKERLVRLIQTTQTSNYRPPDWYSERTLIVRRRTRNRPVGRRFYIADAKGRPGGVLCVAGDLQREGPLKTDWTGAL